MNLSLLGTHNYSVKFWYSEPDPGLKYTQRWATTDQRRSIWSWPLVTPINPHRHLVDRDIIIKVMKSKFLNDNYFWMIILKFNMTPKISYNLHGKCNKLTTYLSKGSLPNNSKQIEVSDFGSGVLLLAKLHPVHLLHFPFVCRLVNSFIVVDGDAWTRVIDGQEYTDLLKIYDVGNLWVWKGGCMLTNIKNTIIAIYKELQSSLSLMYTEAQYTFMRLTMKLFSPTRRPLIKFASKLLPRCNFRGSVNCSASLDE